MNSKVDHLFARDVSKLTTPVHLTPTQLADHLACPHLTQLERQRREGLLQIDFSPDPRLDALRERGRRGHEQAYVEMLRQEGRSVCDWRDERDPVATRSGATTPSVVRRDRRDALEVRFPRRRTHPAGHEGALGRDSLKVCNLAETGR